MHVAVIGWLKGLPHPSKGAGGIEKMVAVLCAELVRQKHQVTLIAPEGSHVDGCEVIELSDFVEAANICNSIQADVVHDHSCWDLQSPVRQGLRLPHISTTHVNHAIDYTKNVVYLSKSQRNQHAIQTHRDIYDAPIIRVPINPELQPKGLPRESHLLYLGRIEPYKGVLEAARVADYLGRPFLIAGPITNEEYVKKIEKEYRGALFMGEVSDPLRSELIEQSHAVMCLFNDTDGWQEPGCGVFGEAMAFDTPVAALNNGCMPELVIDGNNGWIADTEVVLSRKMQHCPYVGSWIYKTQERYNVARIVRQYVSLYERVINGFEWG